MDFTYNFGYTKRIGTMVSTMEMVMSMATSLREAAVVNIFPQEYNHIVASYSCREIYPLYLAKDELLQDVIKRYVLSEETIASLSENRYFNRRKRIEYIDAGLEKELYFIDWLRNLIEKIYFPIVSGVAYKDPMLYEATKSVIELLKSFADEREKVLSEVEYMREYGSNARRTSNETTKESVRFIFQPQSKVSELYDYMSATGAFKSAVDLVEFVLAISAADFSKLISRIKKTHLMVGLKMLAPFSVCENQEWIRACANNLNTSVNSMGKNKSALGKWSEDLAEIL